MKYSKEDFYFLKRSWTFRDLHGRSKKEYSERDLYNLICNSPTSVFAYVDRGEYARAANKIPYILTLLLDELFNIDLDLQKELFAKQRDRKLAWINWNNSTISNKLAKMPWLDTYFGRSNIQSLFESSKRNLINSTEQNIRAVENLLEFIGGLYNIYEASQNTMVPVPVKGPSRTNLKSVDHLDDSPYGSENKREFNHSDRRFHSRWTLKRNNYYPKNYHNSHNFSNDRYHNTNLETVNDDINEIWNKYKNGQYRLALSPVRRVTEDLLKRALLNEHILHSYNARQKQLSSCIDLFEEKVRFANRLDRQNMRAKLESLRMLGNDGSHPGLNNEEVKKKTVDDLLTNLADLMQFMSEKYKGDFSKIYTYYYGFDKHYRAPKPKIITKTVTKTVSKPISTPTSTSSKSNTYHVREHENKSRKHFMFKRVGLSFFVVLVLIGLIVKINSHSSNDYDSETEATSHVSHHKATKLKPKKETATSSSAPVNKVSSATHQSGQKPAKSKASKWVGLYKGVSNHNNKLTLKINADGSVVYITDNKDDGLGKATGYWVNKSSIGIKIYLTSYDNVDGVDKDDMPLIVNMSANKQEIFVKSDNDNWLTDKYTRWDERQHYNLPNSKWVGIYSGKDSNNNETTVKIKPDGSIIYIKDNKDDGVGKATGYWINGTDRIKVYLTHYDNFDNKDEYMPLTITLSDDEDEIAVSSKKSDWTTDHYTRK